MFDSWLVCFFIQPKYKYCNFSALRKTHKVIITKKIHGMATNFSTMLGSLSSLFSNFWFSSEKMISFSTWLIDKTKGKVPQVISEILMSLHVLWQELINFTKEVASLATFSSTETAKKFSQIWHFYRSEFKFFGQKWRKISFLALKMMGQLIHE